MRKFFWRCALVLSLLQSGCISTPHEVVLLHEKEAEVLQELRRTHLAMIDSYIDQKMEAFDQFYFNQYGPAFRKNWEKSFQQKSGRAYDADKDFPQMYNDLVAEYQNEVQPLNQMRLDLRNEIEAAHDQVGESHEAVAAWLKSAERLNTAQRGVLNTMLKNINPSLSLDKVDAKVAELKSSVAAKIR